MKSIGGYFEWEFPSTQSELYAHLPRVNSGRSAFACILRSEHPKKIYMPHYICDSMLEVARLEKIELQKYSVDRQLNPRELPQLKNNEIFFIVNYFSLKSSLIEELASTGARIVVDNVQAFFDSPLRSTSTLYSPRKFFGVPDGGYYQCVSNSATALQPLKSAENCLHLLKRFESCPEDGYKIYQQNEDWIRSLPPMQMSKITQSILSTVDYDSVRARREENFSYLHRHLGAFNELQIPGNPLAPISYPLVVSKPGLREYLQKNRVFVAQYWREIFARCKPESDEVYLSNQLVPLPLDQRYAMTDLEPLVDMVRRYLTS
jgi:hypothetical protein